MVTSLKDEASMEWTISSHDLKP